MSQARSAQAQWDRFRNEAFRAPWLSFERERELLQRTQAGDSTALEELYVAHQRLVVQIASKYARAQLTPEDLVAEGSVGLLEAIRRFDLSQQTRLSTYAAWWVRARVRQYVYAHRCIVEAPGTRAVRLVRARLANAERTLTQELGRTPTRFELAEHLDVAEEDVASVLATASAKQVSSFDACDGVIRSLHDGREDPEQRCARREFEERVRDAISRTLASMHERDRQIIRAHLVDEANLADLGCELGISRQRVSQIVQRAMNRVACDVAGNTPNRMDRRHAADLNTVREDARTPRRHVVSTTTSVFTDNAIKQLA